MRSSLLFVTLAIALPLLALSGCGDDAAPGLESGHPGWGKADCFACHDERGHRANLTSGECAGCHDTNGAPSGHTGDTPCLQCHDEAGVMPAPNEHLGAELSDPDDCLSCH